ncbi:MAG: hypothetical protein RQ847_08695 [Wenzhouxiangellaceae bacterium]|nr:hypothetical protein [Wenzhouxiangellaceae bacterium]
MSMQLPVIPNARKHDPESLEAAADTAPGQHFEIPDIACRRFRDDASLLLSFLLFAPSSFPACRAFDFHPRLSAFICGIK